MKSLKIILSISLVTLFFSCTEDFEKINTNPNKPESVTPDLLLSTLTSELPNKLVQEGWNHGNVISQISAKNNFTSFDVYRWGSESGNWHSYYTRLSEIEAILTSKAKNSGYEGIALILKSIVISQLTDNWNSVPVTEATKGLSDGNFTPKYDSQESIYNIILTSLTKADQLLKNNVRVRGDLIYGGNVSKWRKLANSLKLRYLLRISKRKDVSSEIKTIISEGNIFKSNSDNAVLKFQGNSRVDSWFISNGRIGGFDEHSLSETVFTYMKLTNDPRLNIWFDKSSKNNKFGGIPNGLDQNNARNYDSDNAVSRFKQSLFYDSKTALEAPIMKYSEVEFIIAEAIQRGFISGDAKQHYENGIKSTLTYWGVPADNINDYISNSEVKFDGTVEKILNQKWLALFLVDNESWYNLRRTGLPKMIKPGPDNENDNKVPVRFLYPDNEKSLNKANYEAAVSAIGGDNINSKGWWETGTRY